MEEKPAILILHGWGRGNASWQVVKEVLENKGCLVLAPDLPGFGQEPPPKEPWTLNDYVEWVNDYANKKGLVGFYLLAHSFGGRIAIKFATKYPDTLRGLILVSAAGLESEKTVQEITISILTPYFKKLSFLPGYELLREFFYHFILKKTDYLKAKGIMKEVFKNIIKEDLSYLLQEIILPTLIVWGENDKTLPLSEGQAMNQKIKNSRLEVMKGIDHRPQIETPEALVNLILPFLKTEKIWP
ncbi:MAG: alpha/beta hydrolase [bacterium]|nr:alpha/beta hydrolase [bacterium]